MGVVAVSCGVTGGGDDADEVFKEPIFQTTLKKVLSSSEKQKPRVYRTHSMSGLKVFSGLQLARSLSVGFWELYRLRLVANERSIIDELRMLPKSSYYINIIFIIFVIYIQCPIIKRVITIKKIIWVIIFIYTHQVQISVFF